MEQQLTPSDLTPDEIFGIFNYGFYVKRKDGAEWLIRLAPSPGIRKICDEK